MKCEYCEEIFAQKGALMKKMTIVVIALVAAMCLAGCSEVAIERDTLSILEDGTASYTIISDFSDPSYNLNELLDMAQEEVQNYGDGVVITEAVVEKGVLNFVYTFGSLSDYADFMSTSCFYGTVAQALQEGFKSDTQLISAKDRSTVSIGSDKLKKYRLFVWNEAVSVRCDGNVLYHSANLKVSDKTDVHPASDAAGPYYVIFK